MSKEKIITGKTIVCGVIGDPIEHTMSPALQNAAFRAMHLDYAYLPFQVKAEALEQAVHGIRALNMRGVNVTIPHKQTVMRWLDDVDDLAAKVGAVNTIVNERGQLTGYNTDAPGFLRAMQEKDIDPSGKNVLLLGAGGASRAISFILAKSGSRVTILNRKEEIAWAYDIAENITTHYGTVFQVAELDQENLRTHLETADILVNATSVGMYPDGETTPVPADLLCAKQVVFDIVYNPLPTRLLREADSKGAVTIDGLAMLVWQGAMAFEKWTGVLPPVDIMREAALSVLQTKQQNQ